MIGETRIGPSVVRALPFAAGRNVLTILGIFPFSFLFLPPLFKTPEVVVVGFGNFAWAPNSQK